MIPRTRTARILVGVLAGAIVVAAAVLVWALGARTPPDVSNTGVEFETTATQKVKPPKRFSWPFYGYDAARTHYYPLARGLRPPFKPQWGVRGRVLLEFTPVADDQFLYLLKNNAALYIIRRSDGKVVWKKLLGRLAASAPAVRDGKVFCTVLERKGSKNGRVVAIDTSSRKFVWSKNLASRSETSPVVVDGTVYIGSENGTVYALRGRDGKVRWSKKVPGAVKGGLAYSQGALFFGDYGGQVHSLRARDGKTRWTSGSGGALGIGDGQYYATASVAFGRVYIGNTNGSMYSFSTKDGRLAWRKSTGAYVYSSAAVGETPGVRPDGLLRLLRRHRLRARRAYRAHALEPGGRWTHLRRRRPARRPALLLHPRRADRGGERRPRNQGLGHRPRGVQPGDHRWQAPLPERPDQHVDLFGRQTPALSPRRPGGAPGFRRRAGGP